MLSSLFGVVSHAAATGLCVAQFDVKQAFTQTPMPKDHRKIHVRIPASMVKLIKEINPELDKLYSQ